MVQRSHLQSCDEEYARDDRVSKIPIANCRVEIVTNNLNFLSLALHFLELGKQDLEKKKKESGSDRETGVLEKLLEIDENVALTMTLDSIVAGVDTTSSSFFQLLYALALHPEKQELLRNETMNILPEKDSKLTAENWQNMPYLRACMKESARYAPIFDNIRSAGRDIVMQGYQIPKKVKLLTLLII